MSRCDGLLSDFIGESIGGMQYHSRESSTSVTQTDSRESSTSFVETVPIANFPTKVYSVEELRELGVYETMDDETEDESIEDEAITEHHRLASLACEVGQMSVTVSPAAVALKRELTDLGVCFGADLNDRQSMSTSTSEADYSSAVDAPDADGGFDAPLLDWAVPVWQPWAKDLPYTDDGMYMDFCILDKHAPEILEAVDSEAEGWAICNLDYDIETY